MRTRNVMVMLQLDIKGADEINEVKDAIGFINDSLHSAGLNCNPVIFTEGICEADITKDEEFEIGDDVDVPEPNEKLGDIHSNSFTGTVKDIKGEYIVVEDQEGNCFDIEAWRLERLI